MRYKMHKTMRCKCAQDNARQNECTKQCYTGAQVSAMRKIARLNCNAQDSANESECIGQCGEMHNHKVHKTMRVAHNNKVHKTVRVAHNHKVHKTVRGARQHKQFEMH
ncbi:hypothetical protein CsSME_00018890 [Camellia sinensis var. sinensis]